MFSVLGNWCKEKLREHDGYKDRAHYEKSRAPIMGKSWIASIQHTTTKREFRSIMIPRDKLFPIMKWWLATVIKYFNFYIESFFYTWSYVPLYKEIWCTVNGGVSLKSNSYFCSCSHEYIYASWSVSMEI